MKSARKDCLDCCGRGTVLYQKPGEKSPELRPCPCRAREATGLVGKKGRRMIGTPWAEPRDRKDVPVREMRKAEKAAHRAGRTTKPSRRPSRKPGSRKKKRGV